MGFLRYRKKDYRGALDAFNAGRTSSADLQQLTKFYSGLALGALGLPGQATAEIDQAIRAAPASAFTGPAERLRDSMVATRQGQRRLSAELKLGFFYDDNVPVIPDADPSEPLTEALRRVKHASTGELAGLRADYAWLRTDQWEATIGYSFFGTYNNDLPKFNIMSQLGNLGALVPHGDRQHAASPRWAVLVRRAVARPALVRPAAHRERLRQPRGERSIPDAAVRALPAQELQPDHRHASCPRRTGTAATG